MAPRILAFSGSARRESLNRKLLSVIVDAAREAGGDVTLLDLNDHVMPLYHGDLEEEKGLPEAARRMIQLLSENDGLLIASPEYNSMNTPLLKNTLDWCTRGDDDPFAGKVAAVVSASPGQMGGIRSMTQARQLLTHLGCHVIPQQCILPRAAEAFDESGRLLNERNQKSARSVAEGLINIIRRLRSTPSG
jgi:NAD(P)H-dependent FMN reductase